MRGLEWLEGFYLFFFLFFIHTFLIFLNKLVLVFEKLLDFTISSEVLADFPEDSLLPPRDGNDCSPFRSSFKIKTCSRRQSVGSHRGQWVLIEPFLHIGWLNSIFCPPRFLHCVCSHFLPFPLSITSRLPYVRSFFSVPCLVCSMACLKLLAFLLSSGRLNSSLTMCRSWKLPSKHSGQSWRLKERQDLVVVWEIKNFCHFSKVLSAGNSEEEIFEHSNLKEPRA